MATTTIKATLVVLALCLSGQALAQAAKYNLPKRHFACEVSTRDGVAGLVLVQADTRTLAEEAALVGAAYKVGGGTSPATRVIECIERGKERFKDGYFHEFYISLPK